MARERRQEPGISWDDAHQLLQQAGLKRTTSRAAVLQVLATASAPLTHAEVVERLQHTGLGSPTIFRCLGDLTEAGLATRLDLGDHVWRFGFHEHQSEKAGEHPHFLCVDCGAATCLPDMNVRISPGRKQDQLDFGDITEIVFKGHCPSCR